MKLNENLTSIHTSINKYINKFYQSFKNIHSDTFMEIDGALQQIEYIKYFKVKDIYMSHNIYDFAYHKNYKEVIYIYSCFDKIATLFHLFNNADDKESRRIYFHKSMSISYKDNYKYNKVIIEKTNTFLKSKLFQDFKKMRNNITHNHTMPMEEYFTNLYSFICTFLLIYYVKEILMPNYIEYKK